MTIKKPGRMNWGKARDSEVQEAARRGWPEEALAELKRRGLPMLPPRIAKAIYDFDGTPLKEDA